MSAHAAHDESAAQKADVLQVLEELGVPIFSNSRPPHAEVAEQDRSAGAGTPPGPAGPQPACRGHRRLCPDRRWRSQLLQAFEAMVTRDNSTLTLKLDAPMQRLALPIAMPRC